MINIHALTFNAFQENTYLVWADNGECIIFDPGCSNADENQALKDFIEEKELRPSRLINTHCHIDHVLGNQFVADMYSINPEAHKNELAVLESCKMVADMYGIPYSTSPPIHRFLKEGEDLIQGHMKFEIFFTPGHSPGSLCFYNSESKILIGGDVLFYGSIGRTDLPGGDYGTLMNSISEKLLKLSDDTVVYPGHGPLTNIGFERANNPFINSGL